MSGKRPSLADSMRAVAEAPEPKPAPRPQLAAVPTLEPIATTSVPERAAPSPKRFYAATRAEKKKVTVPLSPQAHRQLKLLAVDHGGVEALLTEAVNDLFRKHGKSAIA